MYKINCMYNYKLYKYKLNIMGPKSCRDQYKMYSTLQPIYGNT